MRFKVAVYVSLATIVFVALVSMSTVWRCRDSSYEIEKLTTNTIVRLSVESRDSESAEVEPEVVLPPFDQEWWREILDSSSTELESETLQFGERYSSDERPNFKSRSEFWSYQNLKRPAIPEVSADDWQINPIDAFVHNRLERDGLKPASKANHWVLCRRLFLDVTGLPPSPCDVHGFVNRFSSENYSMTVQRLLESSAFGEHWASFWLDLARYADSNGYEEDELKHYAFPYRDFVIWAMNKDLPFNQFVEWQIAGDLLYPNHPLAVAATGFFTNAPINTFRPQESERLDELADQVGTLGTAMLGLTIGCARCHDHYFDPITQEEYHRLLAIFKDTHREIRYLVPDQGADFLVVGGPYLDTQQQIVNLLLEAQKERNILRLELTERERNLLRNPVDPSNQEQAALLAKCMRCLDVEERLIHEDDEPLEKDRQQFAELSARLSDLKSNLSPLPPQGLTLAGDIVSQMPILQNGMSKMKCSEVGPGFIQSLTTGLEKHDDAYWQEWSESPRSALAYWMTDIKKGAGALVARVIVNRIWKNYFGVGLVGTPNDFGENGEQPFHPELLEWLACELVDNGWRLKSIHFLILTSNTYQQECRFTKGERPLRESSLQQHPIRLSAESIRDSILSASGRLNREMYGRPVFSDIPDDAIFNTQESKKVTWPSHLNSEGDKRRRSIYLAKKRTMPNPLLNLFDMPDGTFSCGSRSDSSLPTQALALMNSAFVSENAKFLANEIESGVAGVGQRVDQAFLRILCRYPETEERRECIRFLRSYSGNDGALADLCHALFMTNNFVFRE